MLIIEYRWRYGEKSPFGMQNKIDGKIQVKMPWIISTYGDCSVSVYPSYKLGFMVYDRYCYGHTKMNPAKLFNN
jgi:hypothetical protein